MLYLNRAPVLPPWWLRGRPTASTQSRSPPVSDRRLLRCSTSSLKCTCGCASVCHSRVRWAPPLTPWPLGMASGECGRGASWSGESTTRMRTPSPRLRLGAARRPRAGDVLDSPSGAGDVDSWSLRRRRREPGILALRSSCHGSFLGRGVMMPRGMRCCGNSNHTHAASCNVAH